MAQTVSVATKGLGSACNSARFFVGTRRQLWGDTALMVMAILASAFLSRALHYQLPASAAGVFLAVAAALIGWLFIRQLARGERGWMFYAAMLLFGALPSRGDMAFEAGAAPVWAVAVALLTAVPAVVGIVGAVRTVRALDEMWRQTNYRALAFAFIATLIAVLAQWLLEPLGFVFLTWWRLPLLMAVLWGVGMIWAYRRLK